MPGPAGQPPCTTARISITRYLRSSPEPKTPEHLRTLILDEALLMHLTQVEAVFPGSVVSIEDLVVENTKAVLRGRLRDVRHDNTHGVPAFERGVDVAIFVIYEVNHDRAPGHSTALDTFK
ncbi:ester cyclase [Deinococcus yavapaiensis]|uniref:Uncharacterized protein n=1 Tax=Deinococcus yavapaiensis KR-236 TaxID=694435 RepID=A0A318S0M1_9DEIO|nr:ester cyclase [Deinococcus yavapaiensis]PYE50436.1 hypothetical protein DES52_11853 [Deinococcus yavapaiensis KR-236]